MLTCSLRSGRKCLANPFIKESKQRSVLWVQLGKSVDPGQRQADLGHCPAAAACGVFNRGAANSCRRLSRDSRRSQPHRLRRLDAPYLTVGLLSASSHGRLRAGLMTRSAAEFAEFEAKRRQNLRHGSLWIRRPEEWRVAARNARKSPDEGPRSRSTPVRPSTHWQSASAPRSEQSNAGRARQGHLGPWL